MNVCVTVGCVLGFTCWSIIVTRREMCTQAESIRYKYALQEAERKSMRKMDAVASASHEVRTALAGITGLIHMCRAEAAPRSSLDNNLKHMESCTSDLESLLNSILDTTKIESGMMQVEEEEFDLQDLLEDVVDLYYPVGMEKGVDVILDPCDGSVENFRDVKGDRGKLKQILCNLLYNSIKFTDEGYVSLRVRAIKNHATSDHDNDGVQLASSWSYASRLLFGGVGQDKPIAQTRLKDNDDVEYIFDVVDTGRGIPKEKQKFVFENYVQIKERGANSGHLGHGLGLGIVRSLVRLMGGEIGIVDKEIGERGACFRFNLFLKIHPPNNLRQDIESQYGSRSHPHNYYQCSSSSKVQGQSTLSSQVVLFIQSEERSEVVRRFLEFHGVKVSVINKGYTQLSQTLKKIRRKLSTYSKNGLSHSSSSSSLSSSRSRAKEAPTCASDGTQDTVVLIIIDKRAGPFPEVSRAIAEFQRQLHQGFAKVVWIDMSSAHDTSTDIVLSKPLHGSRLPQILELLPEFAPTKGEIQVAIDKEEYEDDECGPSTRGGLVALNKPLQGKRLLIVEDTPLQRKICMAVVSQLGAQSYTCDNGAEAIRLVYEALQSQDTQLPFDYIIMDCEVKIAHSIFEVPYIYYSSPKNSNR
ncbi:unnamed protein product [Cuscuta epithymum]|uniref:histidine kinase n=1 Tax=Cuscuta epithymum TaxID=186058 RepID=A0AAV0CTK1_9ASTE|nr:unnamed protein product [Cuscuta epithymum]CAH9132582.1 unnamed protein product [Cuscuta epithymum]